MKRQFINMPDLTRLTLLVLLSMGLLAPAAVYANVISKTARAGTYSVTLKVLPAETFGSTRGDMKWDGGARTIHVNGLNHPDHHLVAFVKEYGKPVEHAKVSIYYRNLSQNVSSWIRLPVARMQVEGKGPGTTHYGNNVRLPQGTYEAEVRVNQGSPAMFQFTVAS